MEYLLKLNIESWVIILAANGLVLLAYVIQLAITSHFGVSAPAGIIDLFIGCAACSFMMALFGLFYSVKMKDEADK